jgi:hypothetical protein
MNASRSAPITALVICTPCGYARPAWLFSRFEESVLAKRALIVLVRIFTVFETERPAIAVSPVPPFWNSFRELLLRVIDVLQLM